MKKLFYCSTLAFACTFLSCSKEEVLPVSTTGAVSASRINTTVDCRIPINKNLNLRVLPDSDPDSGPRFSFKKETNVKIEQMHSTNTNQTLTKYAGTCLIASGLLLEFSVQEQVNSVGAFVTGRSQFKINGKVYEAVDFPDEAGKGIVSFLSLRLPNGRLIPQQGYILRKVLYFFLNTNDIGIGQVRKDIPLPSDPQAETHLSVIKQNARIELSGSILRLPAN